MLRFNKIKNYYFTTKNYYFTKFQVKLEAVTKNTTTSAVGRTSLHVC